MVCACSWRDAHARRQAGRPEDAALGVAHPRLPRGRASPAAIVAFVGHTVAFGPGLRVIHAGVAHHARVEANYNQFIAELTALTRKYGVAIQSVGGVTVADQASEFADVTYIADISSGDLYPGFPDA